LILERLTNDQQEQPTVAPSIICIADAKAFPSRSFLLTDLHHDGNNPHHLDEHL
jgi:hypothetical protein